MTDSCQMVGVAQETWVLHLGCSHSRIEKTTGHRLSFKVLIKISWILCWNLTNRPALSQSSSALLLILSNVPRIRYAIPFLVSLTERRVDVSLGPFLHLHWGRNEVHFLSFVLLIIEISAYGFSTQNQAEAWLSHLAVWPCWVSCFTFSIFSSFIQHY